MKNVWEWQEFRWYLKEPWKWPKLFCKNIKYSGQRITKGYCDRDLWDIDHWFMKVIPDMLQQFKETRDGSPSLLRDNCVNDEGSDYIDSYHEEFDKILAEMIFWFREMDEETCQRKNIYEEEHKKIFKEFEEKYGILGQKLVAPNEKSEHGIRAHFPDELPEYQDIEKRYYACDKELDKYRAECKDKAFALFAKYFYELWD